MPSEAQILLEAVLGQIATAALIIFTLWPLTLVNWLYVYVVPCIISSASHSKLLRLMWCSYVHGNPAQRQFGLVSWILSARAQTQALTGMLRSKIFLGHQLSGRYFHVFSLFYLGRKLPSGWYDLTLLSFVIFWDDVFLQVFPWVPPS